MKSGLTDINYPVFLFFVACCHILLGFSGLALGFVGPALNPDAFERLVLSFFGFGDLKSTTTDSSGGELFSGQDVKTLISRTF